MKVLFLIEPAEGSIFQASFRFRVQEYLPRLQASGIQTAVLPAISLRRGRRLLHRLNVLRRVLGSELIFIQRHLYSARTFDLLQSLGRPIVYDYDDALYAYPMGQTTPPPPAWMKLVQARLRHTLTHSSHVIASCQSLAAYARKFNSHVSVIPTAVSAHAIHMPQSSTNGTPVIGWIGRAENLIYIQAIVPALRALYAEQQFTLRIVCNEPLEVEGLQIENRKWSLTTEEADIHSFDIAIVPLIDAEWSRGKFSLKTVQAMAAGLPVVVSPIGGNREIVSDGQNGLWACTQEEWQNQLGRMLRDPELRAQLGQAGRETVLENFTFEVNFPKLLRVVESLSKEMPIGK